MIRSCILLCALLSTVLLPGNAKEAPAARIAPDFTRTGLHQERVTLSDYRGKVVLLNFWATWCAPCQIEIPQFIEWQKEYGPQGLQIVSVSMDDDAALVRAVERKHPFNYPVVMGDPQLGKLYGGVLGLPLTLLIDRQGRIRERFTGETKLSLMQSSLQHLLAPSSR